MPRAIADQCDGFPGVGGGFAAAGVGAAARQPTVLAAAEELIDEVVTHLAKLISAFGCREY